MAVKLPSEQASNPPPVIEPGETTPRVLQEYYARLLERARRKREAAQEAAEDVDP